MNSYKRQFFLSVRIPLAMGGYIHFCDDCPQRDYVDVLYKGTAREGRNPGGHCCVFRSELLFLCPARFFRLWRDNHCDLVVGNGAGGTGIVYSELRPIENEEGRVVAELLEFPEIKAHFCLQIKVGVCRSV